MLNSWLVVQLFRGNYTWNKTQWVVMNNSGHIINILKIKELFNTNRQYFHHNKAMNTILLNV
jgi:hypothetical protein